MPSALRSAAVGGLLAAAFAGGYVCCADRMALSQARRLCAQAAIEPEVNRLLAPRWYSGLLPPDTAAVCRLPGDKAHFSFEGVAGYKASCEVSRWAGEVTAAAVVEQR